MNVLAFFTNSGIPAVGLSPTIKIRDVLTGVLTISGANMTETGDGFYYYSFVGYEYETDYAIVCDGGSALADAERYVFAGNENYINDIGNVFDTNTTLSGIQEDLNNPDQYKADVSGLTLTGEYDATLSGIQADLDNPDQYKATGFAVPTDVPTVSEIDTELINNHGAGSWTTGSGLNEQGLHDGLDAYINKDGWKATGFSVSGEYDATLSGIQADLDNPDQYKANISALALESTTSGIKDQTDQLHFSGDNVQSKVTDKGVLNDVSVSDIDTQLSNAHGSGDWDQVATVSGLETKLNNIQSDLDNPDQYKADVSGLAIETTASDIKERTDRIPDSPAPAQEYDATLSGIPNAVWDAFVAGHTVSGTFGRLLSDIKVGVDAITIKLPAGDIAESGEYTVLLNNIEIYILRNLGLSQENYYLDQTVYVVYQDAKLLTEGRIRIYSDAASVGTDSNIAATYIIAATWTDDKLQTYKVVKQ